MKLPVLQQLNRQDFPDAPNWISKLLYPLQLFMTVVINGLTNQLTFQDNFACVVRQFSMVGGATNADNTFAFSWPYTQQPISLIAHFTLADGTYSPIYPIVSWNQISGNISINGVSGLTTGVKYNVVCVVC